MRAVCFGTGAAHRSTRAGAHVRRPGRGVRLAAAAMGRTVGAMNVHTESNPPVEQRTEADFKVTDEDFWSAAMLLLAALAVLAFAVLVF